MCSFNSRADNIVCCRTGGNEPSRVELHLLLLGLPHRFTHISKYQMHRDRSSAPARLLLCRALNLARRELPRDESGTRAWVYFALSAAVCYSCEEPLVSVHAEYDFDAVIDRDSNPLMLCLQDHSRSPPRDVELEGFCHHRNSSTYHKEFLYWSKNSRDAFGDV